MSAAVPKGKGGVDRNALPRYPDGSQWWPPGVARDADDATLAAALRGAWGTPRWVLDIALDVRKLMGGPAASRGFDLDAGTRPGAESWELSHIHADGWGEIVLDVNRKVAGHRRDALGAWYSWRAAARSPDWPAVSPTVWCNFPFNDPKPWVERAIQAAHDGCWVSVLAPHTTGAWWDDLEGCALATVRLRKVCFEACPGLLDDKGRPATGNAPSQQCSLVTLAPPGVAPPTRVTTLARLRRVGDRFESQNFVIQPGPGLAA